MNWNTGGWFGAQLGSSIWILITGVFYLINSNVLPGISGLAIFILINFFGLILWSRRAIVSAYSSYKLLLVTSGILSTVFLVIMGLTGEYPFIDHNFNLIFKPFLKYMYLVVLIFPALFLQFWLINKSKNE